MDYKGLNDQIKQNKLKNVYLFNVNEDYIANMMLNNLKESLLSGDFASFNYTLIDDKKVNVNRIKDICETLPVMDEKRVVLLKSKSVLNKDTSKELSEYILNFPKYTILIIWIDGSMDKRISLYKAIKKTGEIVDYEKFKEAKLNAWIRNKIRNNGFVLTNDAVNYFINASGYLIDDKDKKDINLGYFISEIEKLKSLSLKEIDLNTIRKTISINIKDEIFKLTDAMTKKDSKNAFLLYSNLKYNNVSFMQILAVVRNYLKRMYICKEYTKIKKTEQDILKDYSMNPYAIKMANRDSKNYTLKDLQSFLDLCFDLEYSIKSGRVGMDEASIILIEKITNRK